MMRSRTDLPRPNVEVSVNAETGQTHVVISRDGKAKSYPVDGISPEGKIKDAVEKVIGDGHTAEWLP